MKNIFILFLLCLFILPSLASATDWYVRPAGGNYGTENGSSYANAWDGMENIGWNQVQAGDTLYICGTHLVNESGGITETKHDILINTSGSMGNPVTISGDCAGDEGVVWGHWIDNSRTWTNEGNNTYSTNTQAGMSSKYILEDINGTGHTKLIQRNSVQEVMDNPGSYYSTDWSHAGGVFYVHASDGGDPAGRIAFTSWGYQLWPLANSTDIYFRDLKWYGINRFILPINNSNMRWRWEDCLFHISTVSEIFAIYDNNHNLTWERCTFEYSQTAIYTHSNTNYAPSYGTVRNCTITEQGTDQHGPGGDNHGLGIQGGHDWMIEYNDISKCNEGIVFYLDETMDSYNNTVRYNYIHDLNDQGNAFGMSFSGDTNSYDADHTGNKIYNNIVMGNQRAGGRGLYWKWSDPADVFNNVFYNFDVGVLTAGTGGFRSSIKLRNNILLNIGTWMIYVNANGAVPGINYTTDSDYNLFYPVSGDMFYLIDNEGTNQTNFTGWQSISKTGCTFDPHSLTLDPLVVNAQNGNFHLQADSPAIDSGVNVGLTKDYEGNPIPQGIGFDKGAFEYLSGQGIPGDLNRDGLIDILDLGIIAIHFGRRNTYPSWNATADVVGNYEIDVYDLVFVASRFNSTNIIGISFKPSSGITNDIVKVPVSIRGNLQNITAFGIYNFTFDSNMLQYINVSKGDLTADWAMVDGNEVSPGAVISGGFAGAAEPVPVGSVGSLEVFNLRVTCSGCVNGQQVQVCIKDYIDHISGMKPDPACANFTYIG